MSASVTEAGGIQAKAGAGDLPEEAFRTVSRGYSDGTPKEQLCPDIAAKPFGRSCLRNRPAGLPDGSNGRVSGSRILRHKSGQSTIILAAAYKQIYRQLNKSNQNSAAITSSNVGIDAAAPIFRTAREEALLAVSRASSMGFPAALKAVT